MIEDSTTLKKGQMLKIDISCIKDRLSKKLLTQLSQDPVGRLIGYKVVDGNQFALVLEVSEGSHQWFFESELSEIDSL